VITAGLEVIEKVFANNLESHLAELAHHFFQAVPGEQSKALDMHRRKSGDKPACL
jgi:hypothetical protein